MFRSKHASFEHALRRYGNARVASLKEALKRPESVKKRLQMALERIGASENSQLRRRGCLAVNTATDLSAEDEATTAVARSVFNRMEQALKSVIAEGQESGELAANRDPREIASLFLTMIGMSVSARAGDGAERLRRAARTLIPLV